MLHSGTFEWTTLLDTTSAHDSEHECIMITQRRARFVPYNLCASRPSTTSTTCSSWSTTSHIALGICPLVAQHCACKLTAAMQSIEHGVLLYALFTVKKSDHDVSG